MNKSFSKIVFVLVAFATLFLQGCATTQRMSSAAAYTDDSCGKNKFYSITLKRCLLKVSGDIILEPQGGTKQEINLTKEKFLFQDPKTGFMEIDFTSCNSTGVFGTLVQIVVNGLISVASQKIVGGNTIQDYAASATLTAAGTTFVSIVSQNRLKKRCNKPALIADQNNSMDTVVMALYREALEKQAVTTVLQAKVQAEMQGTSQQVSVNTPSQSVPQPQNCGTGAEITAKIMQKSFDLKNNQNFSAYLATASESSTTYELMEKVCAQEQKAFSMDAQCRVGCITL